LNCRPTLTKTPIPQDGYE